MRTAPLALLLAACAPAGAPAPARPAAAGPKLAAPGSIAPAPAASAAAAHATPVASVSTSPALTWLKGQTHVHSSGSYDARTPPDEVLRFYREHGYDFVAITDHNRVTVVDAPEGLLLVHGVEITQNSATCEPPPRGPFRCLFHTSALFVDPARDAARGARFRPPFVPGRRAAYQAQMDLAERLGGIAQLDHPHFHFAADGRVLTELAKNGLRLFEISNAALDAQHPGGRADAEENAERLWDEVLTAGALIYGVASDDAHHFSDAEQRRRERKSAYVGDRGWVVVRAERTLAGIRDALLGGRFYASTGIVVRDFGVSAQRLSINVEAAPGAQVRIRFVGRGGRELAAFDGPTAEYTPHGDEGYVRAVVADDAGHKAWLQPLVLPVQ